MYGQLVILNGVLNTMKKIAVFTRLMTQTQHLQHLKNVGLN
mgnify:CR=1 FL=1